MFVGFLVLSFFVFFCLLSFLWVFCLLRRSEVLLRRLLRVHALRDRANDAAHVRDGLQRGLVQVRVEADALRVDEAVQHRIQSQIIGDNLSRLLLCGTLRSWRDHCSGGRSLCLLLRLRRRRLGRNDRLPLRSWHLLGLLGLLGLLRAGRARCGGRKTVLRVVLLLRPRGADEVRVSGRRLSDHAVPRLLARAVALGARCLVLRLVVGAVRAEDSTRRRLLRALCPDVDLRPETGQVERLLRCGNRASRGLLGGTELRGGGLVGLERLRHPPVAEVLVQLRVLRHLRPGGEVHGGALHRGCRLRGGLLGRCDRVEEGTDLGALLRARCGEHGDELLGRGHCDCGHFMSISLG